MASTKEGLLFSASNKDLNPDWRDFLQKEGLLEQIRAILDDIEKTYYETDSKSPILPITSVICPAAENILRWARFPFESVRVVIMGQDPYPKRANACGLAFSVPPEVPIPPSLRNIFRALVEQKIIPAMPTTGDLETWCQQGIVLLNTALTTIEGITGAHIERWQNFTHKLASAIGRAHPGTIYLLFGKPAQALKSQIPKTCIALEWGHPSPINKYNSDPANPKNFINCPAFRATNNMLIAAGKSPINWDPCAMVQKNDIAPISMNTNHSRAQAPAAPQILESPGNSDASHASHAPHASPAPGPHDLAGQVTYINLAVDDYLAAPDDDNVYAFVDGAARGNGRANAIAGYACIIIKGIDMVQIVGAVQPSQGKPPTNNRAELMALRDLFIYAASEEFIQENKDMPLVVGYDSAYAAGCLREWYDKWRAQPSPELVKLNLDIITVAYDFMKRVESARKINWVKISSHEKEPENAILSMEWYLWMGNKKVDELARCACTQDNHLQEAAAII